MAAKKGNKNALGNQGGRPPFYSDPNELQLKVDEYFNNCPDKKAITVGFDRIDVPVYSICGLAYHLGFESRQSFYDYENVPEFSYTIKRARLFIEKEYEEQLSVGNTIGAIFALKNMGWKDKSEQEITTPQGITINYNRQPGNEPLPDSN